ARGSALRGESEQSLLLLQKRALVAPRADRGGAGTWLRPRRNQRRRSRRLSAGSTRCRGMGSPLAARRVRLHEEGHPGALAHAWASHLGPTSGALSLIANPLWDGGDHRSLAAH